MLSSKIKKHLNQLQQKKHRKEFKEFVIEGVKGVEEAIKSNAEVILVIIEGNRREEKNFEKILKITNNKNIPVEFCGRKDIGEIKTTDTFPGVLAVVEQPGIFLEDIVNGSIVCLDGVKDPGNMGTIIRTVDWFGIKNILLSEDCVDISNPKVVRSTMGSIFHVNIFRSDNIVASLTELKDKYGRKIVSLSLDGENLNRDKVEINGDKSIFVFGSESHGVRAEIEKMSDKKYTIPGRGEAESLNVAVSAGILMSKL